MRHRLRVVRAHALAWIGIARLALAIARGRVDQVWVGDSHAVFSAADRFPPLGVGSTVDRNWVWHLGPRLMFSIARDGFKPELHRTFRLLSRIPRTREVLWLFSFGEIDIRCHLVPRVAAGDRLDFIGPFVDRLQEVADDLRVPHVVYVVPVPVGIDDFDHEAFPVVGTNEERRTTHGVVRTRVQEEIASRPRVLALDFSDEFCNSDGWYRSDFHTDGIHASDAGRAVVQSTLRQFLATSR